MIDRLAIIDPTAEIDLEVSIGPYSIIGANVCIGKGTSIGSHVVIKGPTNIGEDNKIFQFASVGEDPQDMKYAGEETRLEIGDRNTIREFCTLNRGTVHDQGVTRLGNDNLLMAYVHIAHDCQIGNNVILANGATLGGHVKVANWVIVGGHSMVHQFCHIGAHAFVARATAVLKSIPPYVMTHGDPAKPYGINFEGLRRRSFSKEAIKQIMRGYRLLYREKLRLEEAKEALIELAKTSPEVKLYVDFLQVSERSIIR